MMASNLHRKLHKWLTNDLKTQIKQKYIKLELIKKSNIQKLRMIDFLHCTASSTEEEKRNMGYSQVFAIYKNSAGVFFHTCVIYTYIIYIYINVIYCMYFLHAEWGWHFPGMPQIWMCPSYAVMLWLCCQVLATNLYLEPASGTPQSTRRSRSSQTLPRGSGGDTCPRSPTHGGRREESGSRSDIDLQPGRPVISPETQTPYHTPQTHSHAQMYDAWINTSSHPLRAHVHTLVHRHVLDDGAEGKSQSDIVWPVETAFENGAAIWNTQNQNVIQPQKKWPIIDSSFMVTELSFHQTGLCSLTPDEEIPLGFSPESTEALTCQQTQPITALTSLQCVDGL